MSMNRSSHHTFFTFDRLFYKKSSTSLKDVYVNISFAANLKLITGLFVNLR